MTKNEYTQCSTYATAGDLTTDDATGNYVYHAYNYNQCIGCKHKDCPYWRPPCCRKHRPWPYPHPWPYPYDQYYPWWQWIPPYPPGWNTGTTTWIANDTQVIYTS